jgi:ribosomal protein S18 acetylase RimI-like enzyme
VHPDEDALVALVRRTAAEPLRGELLALFERMGSRHPREPHWYLPLIGVDPAQQSSGHGSALLRHGLARCDRDHLIAYLESTNPRNIPLYERHGFAVVDTVQVGNSPPIFPMLRQPASAPRRP